MPLALRLRKNATRCTISAQTWSTESTWWSWTGRFQSWDGHRRVSKNGNSITISGHLLARRCGTGSGAGVTIFNRLAKCAHIFIGSKEVGDCRKLTSIGHPQNRNFQPSKSVSPYKHGAPHVKNPIIIRVILHAIFGWVEITQAMCFSVHNLKVILRVVAPK